MKKIIRRTAEGQNSGAVVSAPVLCPVIACRHSGMLPELLVEV
jgi:hypothetical protein